MKILARNKDKGKRSVSSIYEYRIKSDINKKIEIFQEFKLSVLEKNSFINDKSIFSVEC